MHNIYTQNWFGNIPAKVAARQAATSIDWSEKVKNFVEYLYSTTEIYRFAHNRKALQDELTSVVSAMGAKCNSLRVNAKGGDSYTDGKNVVIGMKAPEGKKFANNGHMLDVLYGLTLHEGAHLLYTDFESFRHKGTALNNPLVKHLQNLLEDTVIERALSIKKPGYAKFLNVTNEFYFNDLATSLVTEPRVNELDEFDAILFLLCEHPSTIAEVPAKMLDKYAELFVKVKEIIDSYGLGTYTDDIVTGRCISAAIDIKNLLNNYFDLKNASNEEKKYSTQPNEVGEPAEGMFSMMEADESSTSRQLSNTVRSRSSISETNMNERDYSYMMDRAMSDIEAAEIEEENEKLAELLEDDEDIKVAPKPSHTVRMMPAKGGSSSMYASLTNLMKPMSNRAKKIIVKNAVVEKDTLNIVDRRRNGQLDTTKFAEALQDINTVFSQRLMSKKKQTNSSKYAFVLCLDESGSMLCKLNGTRYGKNAHNMVSALAVMFYNALKTMPDIELYIYGHGDFVVPYYNGKNLNNPAAFAERKIQGNQFEASAFDLILRDVRRQTNLPIVLMNITDSMYAAGKEYTDLLEYHKSQGTSFSVFSLLTSGTNDEYVKNANDTLYGEGNWGIMKGNSEEALIEMIDKMAEVVANNYVGKKVR